MDYGFRHLSGARTMPTAFVDAAAVEAWDAWFRWRDGNELRDVTVDATWSRVIGALRSLDAAAPALHEQRIGDAIGHWRLLVDERILARAGTPGFAWPRNDVVAAVNLARFVALPFTPKAALQAEALADAVALSLRLLDDVRCAAGEADAGSPGPRLGIVGLADALAMLGTDYTDRAGLDNARAILRVFADAVARGSAQLARERGAADGGWRHTAIVRAQSLGLPPATILAMQSDGLRFGPVSALMPLPRLALVANNVADAAQPLAGERKIHAIASPSGERRVTASGFAPTLWRMLGARHPDPVFPFAAGDAVPPADRLRMCETVRPWFDRPDCAGQPCAVAVDAAAGIS